MNIRSLRIIIILCLTNLAIFSCKKDEIILPIVEEEEEELPLAKDFSNEVAKSWMDFFLEIERFTPGYRPPVSARASAYIGLTGYEALVGGMPEFNSFSGYYPALNVPTIAPEREYHWPTVLNNAYATAFARFFPNAPSAQQQKQFELEKYYNDRFATEVPLDVYNRSIEYGETVAKAVFDWSKTDTKGHEGYLRNNDPNYNAPSGEGLWQPTYPDFAPALLPRWGEVRTFAAGEDDVIPPPIPFSYKDDSELYIQATEVMIKVNKIKDGNPDYPDDEWIADFWSDDCPTKTFTPSARWIAIASQAIGIKKLNLDEAVYLYAKIGMALSDAGVRAWHEKYRYNVMRPIDYIANIMGEQQWNTIMCPSSGNYFTPPFPAYPSGHATFGAVASEVLTEMFGSSFPVLDRSHEGRSEFISKPRAFNNFYEMAEENAYSRLPIGVHFRMDAETGLDLGYRIGRKINNLPWKK